MAIIFQILFTIITTGVNLFLTPINRIIATAFPSFSNLITSFNTFLDTYITPSLLYFFYILPPNTRFIVIFYLELLLILYSISLTIHGIIKVIEIIKAVKIW